QRGNPNKKPTLKPEIGTSLPFLAMTKAENPPPQTSLRAQRGNPPKRPHISKKATYVVAFLY
ncbi:MAG: hypothetical protein J6C23_06685, partial [Clostridia bacterium]|nr:hypothetical protein [Clostridia bacterium]